MPSLPCSAYSIIRNAILSLTCLTEKPSSLDSRFYPTLRCNIRKTKIMQYYAGMEAGGTKFICAVAANPTDTPVETISIPTTSSAQDIIQQAINFYKKYDL